MDNTFNYVIESQFLIFSERFSKVFCHWGKYWELTEYFQFLDPFTDEFFKISSDVCKLISPPKFHHHILPKKQNKRKQLIYLFES